jgi:hypothetical protein
VKEIKTCIGLGYYSGEARAKCSVIYEDGHAGTVGEMVYIGEEIYRTEWKKK